MIRYSRIPAFSGVDFKRHFTKESEVYPILQDAAREVMLQSLRKEEKVILRYIELFKGLHFIYWKKHPEKSDHFELLLLHDEPYEQRVQCIYCEERIYFNHRKAASVVSEYFGRMDILNLESVMNS